MAAIAQLLCQLLGTEGGRAADSDMAGEDIGGREDDFQHYRPDDQLWQAKHPDKPLAPAVPRQAGP
ncbi:MAG: hypothetical protein OJJ21_20765 [Ferrovibrio sp.]|uniref:hypothetical protein n=1 Tax=Ferrovibrio sp. TaxID=1917215 RepID=UPI0026056938|nr:hypothetical protein [Ferrovibrio sp.]MCW0236042.1 hypothetical protein [Ferrovibrio sp.]